jgi:nitrate/TMAO reductase-like tetraheme cytochrome c subunit
VPTTPHLLCPGLIFLLGSALFAAPAAARAQGADSCLECHSLPDQALSFKNGEQKSVSLDADAWAKSVHAGAGFDCTACHQEHGEYPHAEVKDDGPRDYAFARSQTCKDCHEEQFSKFMDGVHVHAIQAGNKTAAFCIDCHNPHTQTKLTDENGRILPAARLAIPRTCARCHGEIYDQYKQSAHGQALTAEKNGDVPTCVDCHGVHAIEDPRTAKFRMASPRLCASCHTNEKKMARYGLSTAVLRTYVADFHGSTVTLFRKEHPDQQTNKPVCYDCHGLHDIPHTKDPQKGLKTKANLLKTCQQCHPTAADNFPDAWMSHFIPSRERTPLVYWAGWFYRILIPGTVGGMLLFVSSDFVRRRIDRSRARRSANAAAEVGRKKEDA